jgi:HTH-type transcriptional regulator/antitoxin HigA
MPGEYLGEVIEELGMNQVDLAQRMGRPIQAINEIIKGHKAITPDTALQLEQVTGVPAHIWTSLEEEYRLTLARQQEQEQLKQEAEMVDPELYRVMARLGWVGKTRDRCEKVRELWRFFGVASLNNLKDVRVYSPAFRLSTVAPAASYALAAWLRKGELEAAEVEVKPFDAKRLRAALPKIRLLTKEPPETSVPRLTEALAACGVALVLVPHLPKTYAHGATYWVAPSKVVVQLSIRGAWADIFWFSLFHELAHVLLHGKRHIFIEGGRTNSNPDPAWQKQEDEANALASSSLIPPSAYLRFTDFGIYTADTVRAFAQQIDIDACVVVGRLQHDGYVGRNELNTLRCRYQWGD